MDDQFDLMDSIHINDFNINLDVDPHKFNANHDDDSSLKKRDITVSNIFLRNEPTVCKFQLFILI